MGICRDAFGKLSYTLVTSDKRVYSVTKGENCIIRHYPYLRTNAALDLGDCWQDLDRFPSFLSAVRFLKKNVKDLI